MSDDHPLDGVFAKLDRADEHLDALHADLAAFVDRRPYDFPELRNPDTGLTTIKIVERETPPIRFAVMFGDVIHNLRSALDHLAWQLVLANGSNPTGIGFPIFTSEKEFESWKWPAKLQRMCAADAALVKELQPFDGRVGPHFEALAWVNSQSKIDKHQLVRPVFFAVTNIDYRIATIPPGVPVEIEVVAPERVRLEHDAELARFGPLRPLVQPDPADFGGDQRPKLDVYVGMEPLLEPVFGEGLRASFLGPIADDVRAIVGLFSRTFPPGFVSRVMQRPAGRPVVVRCFWR
jgi:hypothetical protein